MVMKALITILALSGLSTSRQARPDELAGKWVVTISAPGRGEVAVRMTIVQKGSSWIAFSRPDAARAFVSAPKYWLGRILRKVPGRGALAYVSDGTIRVSEGVPQITAALRSQILGNFQIVGTVAGSRMAGELRRQPNGAQVGRFEAERDTISRPFRDYRAIAGNVRQALEAHVYDPRVGRSTPFQEFHRAIQRDFERAQDDLDALGSFYARVRHIGTSHISLTRDPTLASLPLDSLVTRVLAPPDSLVRLTFPATGVAYLYVRKWDQVSSSIDEAFRRVDSARSHSLVLDIRSNGGGDNSAGAALAHLYGDSATVGVFLGRKWYATHDRPPSSAELAGLPRLTRDTGIEILRAIREQGIVVGAVTPRAPYFRGRLYVLTDRGTASASEPLVHHLHSTRRATVIGERTAGAMLTALPHDAGQGWVIVVPEADYIAADGTRLEGRGVTPDIATSANEALLFAGRQIAREYPAPGAIVEGQAHASRGRWPAADSAYGEALRLGGDSVIALTGRGQALAEQRRWDEAFAVLEQALAIEPNAAATLYLVGRTSAISEQRLDAGSRALSEYLRLPARPGLASHAAAHWRLGLIELARRNREGAREHYEAALRLDPAFAEARNALLALERPPDR